MASFCANFMAQIYYMKIVLIGTGNVAAVLGKLLVQNGHTIVQVYGRNSQKAAGLANQLNCTWVTSMPRLESGADLYLLAVSDDAIPVIAKQLRVSNQLVVHTAGSVSKEVLQPASGEYGVLYPLQSLRSSAIEQPGIPFLIDGNSESSIQKLKEIAASIGAGYQVSGDEQRLNMHLAAVWVNNFPNLLYSIAFWLCKEKGLDFTLLEPLIQQTAERLNGKDPREWQTGPAIRHDEITIQRHEQLLQEHPEWLKLYQHLTIQIQVMAKAYSTG